MLKTFTSGQNNPLQQGVYDPNFQDWSYWDGHSGTFPNGTSMAQTPAVTQFNAQVSGRFWVFALGTDQHVYADVAGLTPGAGWSGWSAVLSGTFSAAPTVAVYTFGGYTGINVFARGTDNNLWQAVYDNYYGPWQWRGWYQVTTGGLLGSAPAAATYTGNGDRNELHVFWLQSGTQNYEQTYFPGSGAWSTPAVVTCCYTSAPAAAQYTYNSTLQLWGVGTDYRVYQAQYAVGSGWQGYWVWSSDLGGSAPAVVQYNNQFRVWYVLRNGGANKWNTHELMFNPPSWQTPVDAGDFASAPALAPYQTQLEVWSRWSCNGPSVYYDGDEEYRDGSQDPVARISTTITNYKPRYLCNSPLDPNGNDTGFTAYWNGIAQPVNQPPQMPHPCTGLAQTGWEAFAYSASSVAWGQATYFAQTYNVNYVNGRCYYNQPYFFPNTVISGTSHTYETRIRQATAQDGCPQPPLPWVAGHADFYIDNTWQWGQCLDWTPQTGSYWAASEELQNQYGRIGDNTFSNVQVCGPTDSCTLATPGSICGQTVGSGCMGSPNPNACYSKQSQSPYNFRVYDKRSTGTGNC